MKASRVSSNGMLKGLSERAERIVLGGAEGQTNGERRASRQIEAAGQSNVPVAC